MKEHELNSVSIIQEGNYAVKTKTSNGILVTIRLPECLHERIRQQKINQIFDVLNPHST